MIKKKRMQIKIYNESVTIFLSSNSFFLNVLPPPFTDTQTVYTQSHIPQKNVVRSVVKEFHHHPAVGQRPVDL